jgi:hypothetical protein
MRDFEKGVPVSEPWVLPVDEVDLIHGEDDD